MMRYQQALMTALGFESLRDFSTKQQFRLYDYAGEVDYAERELVNGSHYMAEKFTADANRVASGFSSERPGGWSSANDVARHAIELEERAKALRLMIRLVLSEEAGKSFEASLEASRKV